MLHGSFAHLLALARQLLRNVHSHFALGYAARRIDEHFRAHPFKPRPLHVARELLLRILTPRVGVSGDQHLFGHAPQVLDRRDHAVSAPYTFATRLI
jgi:hypothetical protein